MMSEPEKSILRRSKDRSHRRRRYIPHKHILTISRRLGHASAAITLRVYGHLFTNTDARAAEIMEAAFAGMRTE
jgi:integrase